MTIDPDKEVWVYSKIDPCGRAWVQISVRSAGFGLAAPRKFPEEDEEGWLPLPAVVDTATCVGAIIPQCLLLKCGIPASELDNLTPVTVETHAGPVKGKCFYGYVCLRGDTGGSRGDKLLVGPVRVIGVPTETAKKTHTTIGRELLKGLDEFFYRWPARGAGLRGRSYIPVDGSCAEKSS